MGPEWLVRAIGDAWPAALPSLLEPTDGASQCSYELIRAFAAYADSCDLRYTLGAGTLLGAMRNRPSGLLQWEHDVDVYMPARDASTMLRRLKSECGERCSRRWRDRWCNVLHFRGLVDRAGQSCCGWGFKLYHRHSSACELDVLVLAATHAPFMHGETPLWPIWALPLAGPYYSLSVLWRCIGLYLSWGGADSGRAYFAIPEDVASKSLMSDDARWCALPPLNLNSLTEDAHSKEAEWAWCGSPLSFFQDEYFAPGELFPLERGRFHELQVALPRSPWALLNRTYGHDVAYIARLNEHDGARADLRKPEHHRLLAPAQVRRLPWWRTHSRRRGREAL